MIDSYQIAQRKTLTQVKLKNLPIIISNESEIKNLFY
jgi:hypothetical protein